MCDPTVCVVNVWVSQLWVVKVCVSQRRVHVCVSPLWVNDVCVVNVWMSQLWVMQVGVSQLRVNVCVSPLCVND